MTRTNEIRSDALKSLYDQLYKNNAARQHSLELEFLNAEVARNLYRLRTDLRLTQKELSEKTGIADIVIADIEDADFDGNSLQILQEICATFGKGLKLEFVPSVTGRTPTRTLNICEVPL